MHAADTLLTLLQQTALSPQQPQPSAGLLLQLSPPPTPLLPLLLLLLPPDSATTEPQHQACPCSSPKPSSGSPSILRLDTGSLPSPAIFRSTLSVTPTLFPSATSPH